MDTSVTLQPDFIDISDKYRLFAFLLFLSFVIGVIVYRKLFGHKKKDKKKNNNSKRELSNPIRTKYLRSLTTLSKHNDSGKLETKDGYQKLSSLFRSYVAEISGMDATTMTLTELTASGNEVVSKLVESFYAPEFDYSVYSKQDLTKAIEETRKVIKEWK